MIESRIGVTDSGLRTYTPANLPRIYVPEGRFLPLYEYIHKAINHMAALKTYNELTKSYYWLFNPTRGSWEASAVQSMWLLCFGLLLFNLEHTINFEAVVVLSDYHTHNFLQHMI